MREKKLVQAGQMWLSVPLLGGCFPERLWGAYVNCPDRVLSTGEPFFSSVVLAVFRRPGIQGVRV